MTAEQMARLAKLRRKLNELNARATAKLAELKDDTPAAIRSNIEAAHAAILQDIEGRKAEMDAIEAEGEEGEATRGRATQTAASDIKAVGEAAVRADRERQKSIRDIGGKLNLAAEFIDLHALGETTLEQFRALALDEMAKRQEGEGGPRHSASVEIVSDEGENRRRGMVDALVARLARASGDRKVEIPAHARAYGEMGLPEIAAECIGFRGALRTAKQVTDVFDRAFEQRAYGALSTSDFPGIFLDAMNKRLLARYGVAAPTYQKFCARYNASDFRTQNVIRAGDFPTLQPLGQNGEIKSGSFSESKETFTVSPYAVRLNISRIMIVNDNLGAIDQILGSAGQRVSDWENGIAYTSLLSASGAGPTLLTDTTAVFASGHSNLAGSGTIIDIANVGVGRAAMMKQTTIDGLKANFVPMTLLCGPDKLTQAEQLLTLITPALIASAVPDSLRRLNPVGDANISGNPWYLFADPAIAPCFVYGYLDGFDGPRMTSQQEFGVQGMSVKLEHDFGVAAVDFRGGYRNPGA